MPATDLKRKTEPLGPLRDRQVVDISTDDFVSETGFICQIVDAGDLTYRTLEGDTDQTETGLEEDHTINVGEVPVALVAVRSSSTVTSIIVGII